MGELGILFPPAAHMDSRWALAMSDKSAGRKHNPTSPTPFSFWSLRAKAGRQAPHQPETQSTETFCVGIAVSCGLECVTSVFSPVTALGMDWAALSQATENRHCHT